MPEHSPLPNDSLTPSRGEPSNASPEESSIDAELADYSETNPLQFVSFWGAIALPFVHGPLLLQGLATPDQTLTFVALLAINLVALYAGHGYNQR